jgi:hypothetical protein
MSLVLDIDYKNSLFYLEGKEEGVDKTKTLMIENLLIKGDYSIEIIADIASISKEYVLEIKKRLIKDDKIDLNKKY